MDFSNYKFGLRGHDIANNFDDMCRIAKETGVPNLQFALARTVNNINFDEIGYDDALAKKIKTQLDEHDLTVSVLGCYINPIDQNPDSLKVQLKRFENFIRYAAVFDARVIGTETGSLGSFDATRSEENYQFLLGNLRPLVKVAEECGVTMAIEPVWQFTIYSVEVMKRLLDDINSDNLAVILDMSNITVAENLHEQDDTINKAFDILGDKIYAVHIKDFTINGDEKKFATTCTGQLNIKLLFERMNGLKKLPDIILDELPVASYDTALENLKKIL